MTNKTLRRILTKTLNVQSGEELAALLSQESKTLQDNLLEFLESLDKAMCDLDRVIDIRDRSVVISSREMMTLNEEIKSQAEKQSQVLHQLQLTLGMLREESAAALENEETDLNKLVETVGGLVESQLNSARDLKALFEEGLRISSVMSFIGLEAQLQASICIITGLSATVKMYFAGHLFGHEDQQQLFSCDENNGRGPVLHLDSVRPSANTLSLTISSTKVTSVLSFVRVEFVSPVVAETLRARVEALLPNVAATLENVRLLQEEKRKQHLESELQTARFVQQGLLPPSAPAVADGALDISGYYQNASECGGDWWSYFRMADGRHIVLVGDVTGHGTGSALVCAVVKGYCDSFSERKDLELKTMLQELNRIVFRLNQQSGRAMTLAALAFDLEREQLVFANAGHPHPLLIHSAKTSSPSRSVEYLVNSGEILGVRSAATYTEKIFPFQSGDQIVLYSDGLTEYLNRKGEMYGERRLRRLLAEPDHQFSATQLNEKIIGDMRAFALGQEPMDDITTVIVKSPA